MSAILRLLPVIATRRGLFIETVLWSVICQTAALAIALGLASTVGSVLAGATVNLQASALILCALGVVASLAIWRESYVSHDLAYRLIGTLRARVFDSLRRALPARESHRRTGDLATTVIADIETLEWLYAHTIAQTLSALLILSASTVVSISLSPLLLLVWVPLLLVGVAVPMLTARTARRNSEALTSGAVSIRSELLDTIRGLRELSGANALDTQLNRITDDTRALARIQTRDASRLGFERAVADITLALAALGTLGIVLLSNDTIAPKDILLAVTVTVAGLGPAAQIADLLRNAGTLRASAERITDVLAMPPATTGVPPGQAPPHEPSVVGESGLVFDQVTFAYSSTRPVLDSFSLHVRPGETVALVGPSGAGKSTAARLALRFWDPDTGQIRIDGTDLRRLTDPELRGVTAAVPQSSPLLRGTIRTNITLGDPDATDEMVERAALAAGLLHPAARLPLGLNTPIGEHGAGLSGGQRARVAIARALLRDPRVLILDEPTASLDAEADTAILEILTQSRARATLLIAHRPATIAAADRQVFLHPALDQSGRLALDTASERPRPHSPTELPHTGG